MQALPTVTAIAFSVAVLAFSKGQKGEILERKIINYSVGDVDPSSEKFDRIYTTIADADEKRKQEVRNNQLGPWWKVKLLQNLGKGKYRANDFDKDFLLILKLDDPNIESVVAINNSGETIDLKRESFDKITDGELWALRLKKTNEIYKYITVLGATRTIPIVKLVTPPPPIKRMTKAQFIKKLKDGERYVTQIKTSTRTCTSCRGRGRVLSQEPIQPGKLNRSSLCQNCNGQKKEPVYTYYRIQW